VLPSAHAGVRDDVLWGIGDMTATSRKTLSFPQPPLQVPLTPLRIRPLKRPATPWPADQKLVERVRREFGDMRGLSPTMAQARRLFHLGIREGYEIFAQLIREEFLDLCADDRYRLHSR
jgi:hypothetical protein